MLDFLLDLLLSPLGDRKPRGKVARESWSARRSRKRLDAQTRQPK